MSDRVIYLDRFELHEGKANDFTRFATDMAAWVEQNEPGAVSFDYYVDDAGKTGTAVFIFSDADALDRHIELASSRFPEAYALVRATEIELLGRPSDQAVRMAASFAGTVKSKLAGFSR